MVLYVVVGILFFSSAFMLAMIKLVEAGVENR